VLLYHLGNGVKYIVRAAHKGAELRDLPKACWYQHRWIERRTSELEGRPTATPEDQA
jgi:Protein of unknwon function (DUF3310)